MKTAHNEWKSYKLAQICSIEIGKTPSRGNAAYWDVEKKTNNVWLSIADIPSATYPTISDSKEYISDTGAMLCKIIKKGTLLVSFKLTIGRMAIAGRDLYSNEAIAALKNINDDLLTTKYLYWFLMYFDWKKYAKNDEKVKGVTLNKAKLKEIVIKIPSRETQNRIVAILDNAFERIDKAIANTEKNVANAKELFESYLGCHFKQSRGDWKNKTLEEISIDFGRGKSKHRPRNDPSLYNGEYPFVQTGDVRNSNQYICEYSQTYNEKGLAQSKLWPTGTVCITIAANIAEIGILTFDSCFPDSVIGVTVDNNNYSNEYLYNAVRLSGHV